jgi:hypothetical protein
MGLRCEDLQKEMQTRLQLDEQESETCGSDVVFVCVAQELQEISLYSTMATADSVAIFAEGTFEEQVK